MNRDEWSDTWSDATPVRWSPKGGGEPDKFIPLATALDRLEGHWGQDNRQQLQEQMEKGLAAQTPWAWYTLETREQQAETA